MFADWVRQYEHPRWTPILIRLRDIRTLDKDFEETLRKAVDRDFACNDPGWLTDHNIRFLFLLDGFDELAIIVPRHSSLYGQLSPHGNVTL